MKLKAIFSYAILAIPLLLTSCVTFESHPCDTVDENGMNDKCEAYLRKNHVDKEEVKKTKERAKAQVERYDLVRKALKDPATMKDPDKIFKLKKKAETCRYRVKRALDSYDSEIHRKTDVKIKLIEHPNKEFVKSKVDGKVSFAQMFQRCQKMEKRLASVDRQSLYDCEGHIVRVKRYGTNQRASSCPASELPTAALNATR